MGKSIITKIHIEKYYEFRFIPEIRSWLVETFHENISLNSIIWLTEQFRNGVFCHPKDIYNIYIKTKIWIQVAFIFSLAVGCECNWASVSRHDPVNTIIADDCEMNGTSGRYYCFLSREEVSRIFGCKRLTMRKSL